MLNTKQLLFYLIIFIIFTSCGIRNKSVSQIGFPFEVKIDTNVILPPSWAFGVLYGSYANQDESIKLVENIIAHDYPIDAFWTDSWIWDWENQGKGPAKYLDFVGDTVSFPNRKAFWTDFLQSKNIKAGMWIWDCIQKTGNEAVYEDFLQKGYFKNTYINTDSWHNGSKTTIIGDKNETMKGTWNGNIDFDNPEAVAYFKTKMKPFFEEGLDFIKLDRTDAIPVCKTMFEMTQEMGLETQGRGFILSHSGGVEKEEYKKYPGKWTDDTRSTWNIKESKRPFSPWLPAVGFQENVAMYTDMEKHFHQIPFLGNDMGGFAISNDGYIDDELYIRWSQFALMLPLTTPFAQPENKTNNIAFNVSERADAVFKKYAHFKMQLFPYIYSYAHRSRLESVNVVRPTKGFLYQYNLGEELLVAPVTEQNATTKKIFLPYDSDWVNYWNGDSYKGGQEIEIPVTLDDIPIFIRKGAIIPLRKYASSVEKGTNETIELHVYLGANHAFLLIEDDGNSNAYLDGNVATTMLSQSINENKLQLSIFPTNGNYKKMPEKKNWEIHLHGDFDYKEIMYQNKKVDYQVISKNEIQIETLNKVNDELGKIILILN